MGLREKFFSHVLKHVFDSKSSIGYDNWLLVSRSVHITRKFAIGTYVCLLDLLFSVLFLGSRQMSSGSSGVNFHARLCPSHSPCLLSPFKPRQISGLRGPRGGRMDEQTDGLTNERKSPCVLHDFVPFGAAAQKA